MKRFNLISLLYLYFCTTLGTCRLRITRLETESPMIVGEGGWLKCEWDGGGRRIYSAKWYIDRHEFYRWTPSDIEQKKVFPRPEFKVDMRKSRQGHVYIRDVTLAAAGMLRCEVSEEGPIFHTEYNATQLDVVDLPDTRPIITGIKPLYEMHRDVMLNCRSPRSKPASELNFYINGEPADTSWLLPRRTEIESHTSLETASLGIQFSLRPRLLRRGAVVVKCAAKIKNLYWESNEVIISVDLPQRASRMEERALESSATGVTGTIALIMFSVILEL